MPANLTDTGTEALSTAGVAHEDVSSAGSSGATLLELERRASKQKWRASLSIISVLAGSALWILALSKLNADNQALPWFLTIILIAVLCGLEALRAALQFTEALKLPGLRCAASEPLSLLESWSIAFVVASVGLFAWVAVHATAPRHEEQKITRFIDIQLVSDADFKDEKSPLPGQQDQKELRKRQSDRTTQQGALDPAPQPVAPAKSQPEHEQAAKQAQKPASIFEIKPDATVANNKEDAHDQPFAMVARPQTQQAQKPTRPTPASKQAFFEEVQQPELVELIENDGKQDATTIFTSGGKSQGGTGAANELSTYMKELHHKIKTSWSPPRGQSRRARVLFRIRHDGTLAFTRIAVSSGDDDTDIAAVTAITQAVGAHPLPDHYKEAYLDVEYTFNYSADEIREVR